VAQAAVVVGPVHRLDEPEPDDSVRPDAVSALVAARGAKHRVEDVSQRDEVTRVYANPDGTWTSETASEPESVQDPATGEWESIDTTLVAVDGGLRPRAGFTDLVLSDGGDRVFAELTEDGQELGWKWTSELPEPEVEGSTATYRNVVSGGDLVVTATNTGFTHNIVLREAPAGPLTLTVPIVAHGAAVVETATGGVVVKTRRGERVAQAPAPLMWDSSEDAEGNPEASRRVDMTIETTPGGGSTMILKPDVKLLADPDTVYPVTIDPAFTTYAASDTWVQTPDFTSSQSTSPNLVVGTYDAGTHVARSFLKFNNYSWTGKQVVSADLVLRNWQSGSCTDSPIRAARITQAWSDATLTWANQPTVSSTDYADFATALGGGAGCVEGNATWNMTSTVAAWAADSSTNLGIRLKAVSETSNNSRRFYRSAEPIAGTPSTYRPKLSVTYDSYPVAAVPTVNRVVNYAGFWQVYPGGAAGYATTLQPTFMSYVSDPDGGYVEGRFEVLEGGVSKWSATTCNRIQNGTQTSSCTSGQFAATVPAGVLLNGHTYTVRVKGYDGTSLSPSFVSTTFTVDTTIPTVAVTATGFTNNTWTITPPASNTFTFDGPADTKSFYVVQDGANQPTLAANASGDATLTWNPARGLHTLKVQATDNAGNSSTLVTFGFGVGEAGFDLPTPDQRSTGVFPAQASAVAGATSAALSWRRAGQTAWQSVTNAKDATGAAWSGSVTSGGGGSSTPALTWNASALIDPATSAALVAPALLEVRACFTYPTPTPQSCTAARQVQLVPQAFGGRFPVASAGPAEVALYTGEYTLAQTDAVDAVAGVGRSFSSYDASTTADGPFGRGWSDALLSATTEDAGARIVDNRTLDKAFVLVAEGWGSQTYKQDGTTSTYKPTGPDDGSRLSLNAAADKLTLTEVQGATTSWTLVSGDWVLDQSVPAGAGVGKTAYQRAGSTAFLAEVGPGTAATCSIATQTAGCRGLKVTYTGIHVTKIERVAYNPVPGANGLPTVTNQDTMTTTSVAEYTYTGDQLTKVCNPSVAATFCVQYAYLTVAGRTVLDTVTPPAQAPWRFSYDTTGRLTSVKRTLDPGTGTGDATWTLAYDLAPTAAGLPSLTASAAAEWGQTDLPTTAYAVFGPNRVPATTPSATDLQYAQVFWTGKDGEVTNTGTYGAGQWLVDTSWYDDNGNMIRHLGGPGYAQVQAAAPADRPQVALNASEITVYNTAGTRVEDEFGPVHTATLKNGTVGPYRSHTSYAYDDEVATGLVPGRPAPPTGLTAWDMVVDTKRSAANADMTGELDPVLTRNSYEPIVAGDGDGWGLGSPTSTKTQLDDGSWVTSINRLNTQGQVIETRQPGGTTDAAGAGNDAHATQFVYYTAGPNSIDTSCGNNKAWAGLQCRVGPAGQPTGASMPTTYSVGFNTDLSPTRAEDRSSTTTRATVTTYDGGGRTTKTSISVTGGDASDPSAALVTDYTYDPNGQAKTQTMGAKTTSVAYDTWARPKTYTDATGLVSTTTYKADGQVATANDGLGIYAYTYDTAGMPTTVDVGLATGPDVFTYTYDAFGNPKTIGYPNGTTATRTFDEIGAPTGLTYTNGTTQLLAFTATVDVDGRTVANTSVASTQNYGYDTLGRLIKVQDTQGTGGCTTRKYGFSVSSERLSKDTYASDAAGACQTTTPSTQWAGSYDSANRIRNTGYTYDNLGRTRTTPAADTAPGAQSVLTNTYYPNDMIASMAQTIDNGAGGTVAKTIDYALDPAGRIDLITAKTAGTETNRSQQRYSGPSDSPSSIRASTNGGASWTDTRYVAVPGIGMAMSITGSVATVQLANLHGDIVATQANTTGTTTIATYNETDEYGNTTTGAPTSRYGYLGTHQRSTETLAGMSLMGARIYNPATAQFTSADPVLGGGATRYAYPTDPINMIDASGDYWVRVYSYHWDRTSCACYKKWGATVGVESKRHYRSAAVYFSYSTAKWLAKANRYDWLYFVAGVLGGLLVEVSYGTSTLLSIAAYIFWDLTSTAKYAVAQGRGVTARFTWFLGMDARTRHVYWNGNWRRVVGAVSIPWYSSSIGW
jgi:RHS repeat-associated protein